MQLFFCHNFGVYHEILYASIFASPVLSNVHDTMDGCLEAVVGHPGHILSHVDHQAVVNDRHLIPFVVQHQLQPRVTESLEQGYASGIRVRRGRYDCKTQIQDLKAEIV